MATNSKMMKFWKGAPTAYREEEYGVGKRLNILFDAGFDPANKVILDLGAGACAYSRVMKDRHAGTVVSMDINRRFLSQAHRMDKVQCSASALPFRRRSFDCVLIIEVLEHLNDDRMCISESARVLKDGAYLLVTVPNSFFILETHGLRVLSTEIQNILGLGIPFMSFLPKFLRKNFERARIYSIRNITRLLNEFDVKIFSMNYMMPPLDKFERGEIRIKNVNMSLVVALREILSKIERTPLRIFGAHIVVIARK